MRAETIALHGCQKEILKTISHFEKELDDTEYFMSGRVEMCALLI